MRRFAGDYHRYLRRLGYSGPTASQHVRHAAIACAAAACTDRVSFAQSLVRDLRNTSLQGIRPEATAKVLVRYVVHARLARDEAFEELLLQGRISSAIAKLPSSLQAELERYRQHLAVERAYRRRTREAVRSLRTEWVLLAYTLVPFGTHLAAEGLDSWQQLTPDLFRGAVGRWRLTPSTRIAYLSAVKRFLNFLVADKRIFRNPLSGVRLPRIAPLSGARPQDARPALHLIASAETRPTVRAVVALVVLHGLTPSEAAALRLDDFRARSRSIVLRGKRSTIALDPLTYDALTAYVAVRPAAPANNFLFVSDRSAKSGRSAHFVSLLRELGIAARAVRHGQIQTLLERENAAVAAKVFGMSLAQIHKHQRLLGAQKLHAAPAVTKRFQDRL